MLKPLDVVHRYRADLCRVNAGAFWLVVDDEKVQPPFPYQKTDGVCLRSDRELLIATFAGVRGAITLAGVLSIPLLLPSGDVFPARYELVFPGRRGDPVLAVCWRDRAAVAVAAY